jgi:hypothetical protein
MTDAPSITLQDTLEFNALLRTLHRSGISISLNHRQGDLIGALDAFDQTFALRHARGDSVEKILGDDESFSREYRAALAEWLGSGRNAAAIEPLVRAGNWREHQSERIGQSATQLWIVWLLGTVALVTVVASITPGLREMYRQSRLLAGPDFRFLEWLEQNQVAVVAISVALAIATWCAWHWRWRFADFRWIPARTKIFDDQFLSARAATLASESPLSAEDALQRVDESASLRWAVEQRSHGDRASSALGLMSYLFQQQSLRRARFGWKWLPTIVGTCLGGLIVLGLGLTLLLPMIEMVFEISDPLRLGAAK